MAALFANAERYSAGARPAKTKADVLEIPFVAAILVVDDQDPVLQANFVEILAIKSRQAQAVQPVEARQQSALRVGNRRGRAGFGGRGRWRSGGGWRRR